MTRCRHCNNKIKNVANKDNLNETIPVPLCQSCKQSRLIGAIAMPFILLGLYAVIRGVLIWIF